LAVTVSSQTPLAKYTITKKDKEGICVTFEARTAAEEEPGYIAGSVSIMQLYG
jgi:hypothetical protein